MLHKLAHVLNCLIALDHEAIDTLVSLRVPCNENLTLVMSPFVSEEGGMKSIGLLGVLNRLFGDPNGAFLVGVPSEGHEDWKLEKFVVGCGDIVGGLVENGREILTGDPI